MGLTVILLVELMSMVSIAIKIALHVFIVSQIFLIQFLFFYSFEIYFIFCKIIFTIKELYEWLIYFLDNGTCEHETGACVCASGWRGPRCDRTCPPGTWGSKCAHICECRNGAECNPENGKVFLYYFEFQKVVIHSY